MRNRTENKVEIYLIRHGATDYNLEGRYLGCRTDMKLSGEGICALRKFNYDCMIDENSVVFSGPMKRCVQTAEALFPLRDKRVISELKEIDFGDFEGKNYKELSGDDYYQKWIDSGGTIAFPNGESREEFIERTVRGFEGVVANIREILNMRIENKKLVVQEKPEAQEKPVVQDINNVSGQELTCKYAVVLHGGNIMAILSHYCKGEYFDYQVKPGHGYRMLVELMDDGFEVIAFEKLDIKC